MPTGLSLSDDRVTTRETAREGRGGLVALVLLLTAALAGLGYLAFQMLQRMEAVEQRVAVLQARLEPVEALEATFFLLTAFGLRRRFDCLALFLLQRQTLDPLLENANRFAVDERCRERRHVEDVVPALHALVEHGAIRVLGRDQRRLRDSQVGGDNSAVDELLLA